MTTGEEAFNIAISGQGYRYAVWPNSSPIPLNTSHALIYAPLVYLQVDMQGQSSPRYTSLGNTLLLISIDPVFGPHADRVHNQFFDAYEVSWGSLGGIRAWTSSGPSAQGVNGDLYLFGATDTGVLMARTEASSFADRSSYNYWTGTSWSTDMPPNDATSNTHIVDRPVMNMDLVYSPLHRTFLLIYLTPNADNTFYYRYLVSSSNTTLNILLPYVEGGDPDYVEQIISPNNKWSEEKVLFSVPAPARGYIYAGGLHAGYFGENDINMGGGKMLCTWTEHTPVDPNVPESGYAHKSMVVALGS
ncbi:hypothetical protein LTR66_016888 [Elasticomyces elasticus]|nr:hypothetical protein LTR66_016888 [Elasticomyces elasticus]